VKTKRKLEIVFVNGDIYEIKPHDQATSSRHGWSSSIPGLPRGSG